MKRFALYVLLVIASALYFPATAFSQTNTPSPTSNQDVAKMTLKDKILSLLIVHTPGTTIEKLSPFLNKYHPAGIILMSDNIPSDLNVLKKLTTDIQKTAQYPLLIAIDQEGCSVRRIKQDDFPCPVELKEGMPQDTFTTFQKRSQLLEQYGINLNFGIVADITSDQESFIYPRVFGGDPQTVGNHIAQAVNGSKGLTLSTIKHFPGHGATAGDSHTVIPEVDMSKTAWQAHDMIPFQKGIAAGTDMVMFAHLRYTSVDQQPASLSPLWHTILTSELGYKGIAITDDMIMLKKSKLPEYQDNVANAIAALNAGNNILLYVNEYNLEKEPERKLDIDALVEGIEEAVTNGTIPQEKIDSRVAKVFALRKSLRNND